MKTLQNCLILALIAVALVYTYTELTPNPVPNPNLESVRPKVTHYPSGDGISKSNASASGDSGFPKKSVDAAPNQARTEQGIPAPLINIDKLPAGEFVTIERISHITDAGVKSFNVGEIVKEVKDGLYTNGKITIPVPASKLTDSRSIATALAMENYKEPVVTEVTPPTPAPAPQLNRAPSGVRNGPNPKEIYNAALDRQIAALQNKIDYLSTKGTSKINANGPTITRLMNEINELESRRQY